MWYHGDTVQIWVWYVRCLRVWVWCAKSWPAVYPCQTLTIVPSISTNWFRTTSGITKWSKYCTSVTAETVCLYVSNVLYYLTDLFGQKWQALKKRNITQNHINETIRKCYCLQVDCPGNSNILPCEETCTMWIMAELVQGATLKD